MTTTTELSAVTGVAVIADVDPDLDIPVLSGFQRQGDVLVLPSSETAHTPVTTAGTPVVRGENGGNTHAIYAADGPVFCETYTATRNSLRVARLTVPDGSTAYLAHPEHGYMGIATGSYEIRRQREFARTFRIVSD